MTTANATTTTSSITTAKVASAPSPSLDYFGNWVIALATFKQMIRLPGGDLAALHKSDTPGETGAAE